MTGSKRKTPTSAEISKALVAYVAAGVTLAKLLHARGGYVRTTIKLSGARSERRRGRK